MSWLLALWLSTAQAAIPFGVDRVDLLSEDPGTFVNYELVRGASFSTRAVRWLTQVKVVWYLPVEGLTVGTSITSQSLFYEREVLPQAKLSVGGGVQTALLLPRGLLADVSVKLGPVRLAVGASLLSGATWSNPDWRYWQVMPTFGLGIGRAKPPPPWRDEP